MIQYVSPTRGSSKRCHLYYFQCCQRIVCHHKPHQRDVFSRDLKAVSVSASQIAGGSAFRKRGAATENARLPQKSNRQRGCTKGIPSEERVFRGLPPERSGEQTAIKSERQAGDSRCSPLSVKTKILYIKHCSIGNQCSERRIVCAHSFVSWLLDGRQRFVLVACVLRGYQENMELSQFSIERPQVWSK